MAPSTSEKSWLVIPEGFQPVPLQSSPSEGTLRLCVLARKKPDPVEGHLVVLRDWEIASVYLGCLLDAADRVWEWTELWVQNPNNLAGSPDGYRERLNNAVLDRQWTEMAKGFAELSPEDFLATGWESASPPPLCLDAAKGQPVEAVGADTGVSWMLCRDDARLAAADLPTYSGTCFRYLHQAVEGGSDKFVPVVESAPENASTAPFAEAIRDGASLVRWNAHGGFMMARRWAPLDWESYVGVLGGQSWAGPGLGKTPLRAGGAYGLLGDAEAMEASEGYLFSARQGPGSQWVETLHLKLQLMAEALREVRAWSAREQRPFLNLSPESFQVRLQATGRGLPCLWTASARLGKPSQALALPVEGGEFRYFLPGKTPHPFVYLPEGVGATSHGRGTVRIREVKGPENGRSVVEGTLVAQEALNISPHDLIWIRLPLAGGRLDLYGHLYAEEGLASGEARFRTLPLGLPAAQGQALKAASGTALSQASFEIVPLLSTPCDLYSLGVLAVRTLLVNEENTLAIALDETLSLARQANEGGDGSDTPAQRVQRLLEGEPRWLDALGPHRLRHQNVEAELAAQWVPLELWSQVLAWVARLFPGVNGEAYAKDYGDAPAAALEAVFNEPLRQAEELVIRSRSLIVIDWNQNREIREILEAMAKKG